MRMLQGKIVFCAPTKPLLNQQVTACYNKMSVSKVQSGHTALLIARIGSVSLAAVSTAHCSGPSQSMNSAC